MMEYTDKYWKMIIPLVKKDLVRRFGKEEAASLIQKTDVVYRDMLNRADDIWKRQPHGFEFVRGSFVFSLMGSGRRENKR